MTLSAAPEAHRIVEEEDPIGKVILEPGFG